MRRKTCYAFNKNADINDFNEAGQLQRNSYRSNATPAVSTAYWLPIERIKRRTWIKSGQTSVPVPASVPPAAVLSVRPTTYIPQTFTQACHNSYSHKTEREKFENDSSYSSVLNPNTQDNDSGSFNLLVTFDYGFSGDSFEQQITESCNEYGEREEEENVNKFISPAAYRKMFTITEEHNEHEYAAGDDCGERKKEYDYVSSIMNEDEEEAVWSRTDVACRKGHANNEDYINAEEAYISVPFQVHRMQHTLPLQSDSINSLDYSYPCNYAEMSGGSGKWQIKRQLQLGYSFDDNEERRHVDDGDDEEEEEQFYDSIECA